MDVSDQAGFFATQVITRVAVPFFFITSGYYYCQKLKNGCPFRTFARKFLIRYCFWSMLYFIVNLIQAIADGWFTVKGYIIDCIFRFFLYGPYYHLWFMPALFAAVCIATFAAKRGWLKQMYFLSLILYCLGVLGCAYYQVGIGLPILGTLYQSEHFDTTRRIFLMGVPFFMAGYAVPYLSRRVKKSWAWLVGLAVLNVCEIYFVSANQISSSVVETFMLYPLTAMLLVFCLQHPMLPRRATRWQRKTSSFVYFVHPLFLMLFYQYIGISQTPAFLLTCIASTSAGILFSKVGNKSLQSLI